MEWSEEDKAKIANYSEMARRWALKRKKFEHADDFAQDVALHYLKTYPFQTPLKYEWCAFRDKKIGKLTNTTAEFRAAKQSLASPSLEPDADKLLSIEPEQESLNFHQMLGSMKTKLPAEKYAVYHAVMHLKHQWGFTAAEIAAVFGRNAYWADDVSRAAYKLLKEEHGLEHQAVCSRARAPSYCQPHVQVGVQPRGDRRGVRVHE